MSQKILDQIEEMDNYVIQHFRIAFGNRIVAHMKKFVPVYVACGGTEVDGVDYLLARKVLRKFEQLNISYIYLLKIKVICILYLISIAPLVH